MTKNIKLFFPEIHIAKEEAKYSKKDLKEMIKNTCKPCWELKYCPYGPLVENFPLPEIPRHRAIEHIEYFKKCLREKILGSGEPLDDLRKKWFKNEIKEFNEKDYPLNVNDELIYMSCSYFGHLCPVFFSAEPFTETEDARKRGRNIPRSILIRVVRRDDSTCQECSAKLLDKDIEIDHIIPDSKGGPISENNLRVLCSRCNKKKSNKEDVLLNERSKVSSRKKYYEKKLITSPNTD